MKPISIQPIPYQGSKRNIAPQIAKYFPSDIDRLVEPFAGSAAITLFAANYKLANKFLINDSYKPLMLLWKQIINNPEHASQKYYEVWENQLDSPYEYFFQIRDEFNKNRDPIHFLYLQARCVKNALRFNSKGEFNQSPDKRRLGRNPKTMRKNILSTSLLLKERTNILSVDYLGLLDVVTSDDFVYMDPPYMGTSNGKNPRYYEQLNKNKFIKFLLELNKKQIRYLLSFDGTTGEKSYGDPLPEILKLKRVDIHAGKSAQATLNGYSSETIESLYLSPALYPSRTI